MPSFAPQRAGTATKAILTMIYVTAAGDQGSPNCPRSTPSHPETSATNWIASSLSLLAMTNKNVDAIAEIRLIAQQETAKVLELRIERITYSWQREKV
jgi:hypothetical protein